MRWLTVLLGAAILAAVAAVVMVLPDNRPTAVDTAATPSAAQSKSLPQPTAKEYTDPCGTFDLQGVKKYAITGYWITPSSNPCTWRHQMEEIHQAGGDTVIRIGYGLQYRTVTDGRILKDGEVDPRYTDCENCWNQAEQDLKAANPGNRIGRTYVYRTDEHFGPDLFRCPGMERTIEAGKRVYYRLITSPDGSDDSTCDFSSKAGTYDLILIAAAAEDSLKKLLELGDTFGVQVFPSLPVAPRDPKASTRANPEHLGTLTTLTRRLMQDYGARFKDRASLGGFYQPFELQMGATLVNNPTLQVYAEQHDIVEQELPGKPILVSPYMDARKRVPFGQTPKQVAEGFRALAKSGVGIIAPQDSRGTGKVGLFWPDQRDDEVDKRLQPLVGVTTYGTAYHGSTRDYYREMSVVRDQLVDEGYEVELWANVESFEPSATQPCQPQGTRGKTDKPRLDAAIAMTGRYVQKVVSYMWSDFFTCGEPALKDEVAGDVDRPIAVDAIRTGSAGQDGLEVRGYHLDSGTVTLSWPGGSSELPITVSDVPNEAMAEGIVTAWVPFDWSQVPYGVWVKVGVRSPAGKEATEQLHVRVSV
ncbi:hypothetical protein GCM10010404_36020 [Nonomuraea africana]|uniref:DUF4434 domain-containing protein n=1 Tax=Nonomuraea africana TaxID=46171 RepID=A0ABR9KSX7_9ACTN|nr:DUF4434 domain-containing protein [Nonomuraea africana]MBE1564703.1 hypothetical protein [Nonomuraea africana]